MDGLCETSSKPSDPHSTRLKCAKLEGDRLKHIRLVGRQSYVRKLMGHPVERSTTREAFNMGSVGASAKTSQIIH